MPKAYKPFQFKQFSVSHANSAMKVGTDSVLLGCMATFINAQNALDIGCGSGLLALMMAQQSNAQIVAVEIDENACKDAAHNFLKSPWADRITLCHQSIQSFYNQNKALKFDWILVNPPYFSVENNYKITNSNRKLARQTTALTFQELIQIIASLLDEDGMAGIVLPTTIAQSCKPIFESFQLYIQQEISIHSFQASEATRTVICLQKKPILVQHNELIIYELDKQYTAAYYELTKDFYLWADKG
jgi:tRNA1Val (adenine37-N6)-methyltransferase